MGVEAMCRLGGGASRDMLGFAQGLRCRQAGCGAAARGGGNTVGGRGFASSSQLRGGAHVLETATKFCARATSISLASRSCNGEDDQAHSPSTRHQAQGCTVGNRRPSLPKMNSFCCLRMVARPSASAFTTLRPSMARATAPQRYPSLRSTLPCRSNTCPGPPYPRKLAQSPS